MNKTNMIEAVIIKNFNKDYKINDKLTFHHPTIKEFINGIYTDEFIKECEVFVVNKENYIDLDIAFENMKEYEFLLVCITSNEQFKEIFNNKTEMKFYPYIIENTGEIVLYEKDLDIIITEKELIAFKNHMYSYIGQLCLCGGLI